MNPELTSPEPSLPEMLAIAEQFGADTVRQLEPDDRVIYGAWGIAWFVGFLAQWVTAGDDPRIDAAAAASWLFAGLVVAAIATTVVHISRRVRGLHGPSVVAGRRYSAVWATAFVTYGVVLAGLDRAGATGDVAELVPPLLACFIVGMLYLAGGAIFSDALQFRLGVWICSCVAVAAVVGVPGHHLVLGVGGGGGLLVGAALAGRVPARRG